jgi:excisionase family DNA binding protein
MNAKEGGIIDSGGQMLTSSQVARILNVHVNTARRWGDEGKIEAVRSGTRKDRKFPYKGVMRMLENSIDVTTTIEPCFTLSQTATIFNCRVGTVRKWEAQGKLESLRLGSRRDRRFSLKAIKEFIENSNELRPISSSDFETEILGNFLIDKIILIRPLLGIDQVAKLLNVHKNAIRRWDERGYLTSIQLFERGDRRYAPQSIEQFLRKNITSDVNSTFNGEARNFPIASEEYVPIRSVLTTSQTAKLLCCSINTIGRLEVQGLLRSVHLSQRGDKRFLLKYIIEFLKRFNSEENKLDIIADWSKGVEKEKKEVVVFEHSIAGDQKK